MPALFVVDYQAGKFARAPSRKEGCHGASPAKNLLPDKPDSARQSVVANHHISLYAFIGPIHIHR